MIDRFYNIGKKKLFPLNRSITGKDTFKSLQIISKNFKKFKIRKIQSGTKVFDWKIPPEWNVKEAHVLDKNKHPILYLEWARTQPEYQNDIYQLLSMSYKINGQ